MKHQDMQLVALCLNPQCTASSHASLNLGHYAKCVCLPFV